MHVISKCTNYFCKRTEPQRGSRRAEGTRQIADGLQILSHKVVWETVKRNGIEPFHIQPVRHLQEDYSFMNGYVRIGNCINKFYLAMKLTQWI